MPLSCVKRVFGVERSMAKRMEFILLEDGSSIDHPVRIQGWTDNTKYWPAITYDDIYKYMIESKSVDGKSYKGLDSFNYFISGWVVST